MGRFNHAGWVLPLEFQSFDIEAERRADAIDILTVKLFQDLSF